MKQLVRNLLGAGAFTALRNFRWELKTRRHHLRALRQARAFRGRTGLKLHLGCGDNIKPGFVNIDLGGGADLALDLREPLPFSDGSCALVYSEHFFEHVPYPEGMLTILRDCWRVLQPGGVFSAGVPNTRPCLLEYAGITQTGLFERAKVRWHPKWCETPLEHINFHFRQGEEHKFAYDAETFCQVLQKAGFVKARQREFEPGLDQPSWQEGTLFVQAEKPAAG